MRESFAREPVLLYRAFTLVLRELWEKTFRGGQEKYWQMGYEEGKRTRGDLF